MPQARFMFRVSGDRQTGILYVLALCQDAQRPTPAEMAHATRAASRRSGDPAPEFVRIAD